MTFTIDAEGFLCNFIDRIKNGSYDPKEAPTRPTKPYLIKNHNVEDVRLYVERLDVYEASMKTYNMYMHEYAKHKRLVFQQFKTDTLEYCGLTTHPKADRAFEMAWDGCRDSGMVQIVEYLEELSELMLP